MDPEDELDKFVIESLETVLIILQNKVEAHGEVRSSLPPYLLDSKADNIIKLIFPTPDMYGLLQVPSSKFQVPSSKFQVQVPMSKFQVQAQGSGWDFRLRHYMLQCLRL